MSRDYEITPRPAALGGGWKLRLVDENGQDGGGGIFPVVFDAVAGIAWWNHLGQADRAEWLLRAGDGATWQEAYLEHLSYEAHEDAVMLGNEWIESFLCLYE